MRVWDKRLRLAGQRLIVTAGMTFGFLAGAQTPGPAPLPGAATAKSTDSGTVEPQRSVAEIGEDQLRRQLLGKTLYLRDGYADDTLHFDENGKLDGASPRESFTLSLVQITRIHLGKHRLELEGDRYGLHFLGALPSEEQSTAVDKVRLTSKKKPLRISIDREELEKPKKKKEQRTKQEAGAGSVSAPAASPASRASEPGKAPSVAEANRALEAALDRVFASEMDAGMIATLPEFWQLYYQAAAAHSDYPPEDAAVLRQNQVDRKAKLVSVLEPASNVYAQKSGVAGLAMYHVVVGTDGLPVQISAGRPIGFGLDENAVAALRRAKFEPARKDGKPVPVLLDVVVEFRIYSKRTEAASHPSAKPAQPAGPILPGPYSVSHTQ